MWRQSVALCIRVSAFSARLSSSLKYCERKPVQNQSDQFELIGKLSDPLSDGSDSFATDREKEREAHVKVFAYPVFEGGEDPADCAADERGGVVLLAGGAPPAGGEGRVLPERGPLQRAPGGRGRGFGDRVADDGWDAGSSRSLMDDGWSEGG